MTLNGGFEKPPKKKQKKMTLICFITESFELVTELGLMYICLY